MAQTLATSPNRPADFPATARLRAELLIAPDAETLVSLFALAMAEHGINGHFCLRESGDGFTPLLGDQPELIRTPIGCIVVDTDGSFLASTRMLLDRPVSPLGPEKLARVRGYAQLFAARAVALQELADDVETECGLSLRERYVLGRRLAGLAPIDIAIEAGLSVATVSAAIDSAIERLGATTLAEATSLAARRGWLAVTTLQNCSSTSRNLTYKAAQNG
jgi:DNA-binding CsgD family transcriptional regulator